MKFGFYSVIGAPWGGSEVLWVATAHEALGSGHKVVASVFHWPEVPAEIARLKARGGTVVFRRRFYPSLPRRVAKFVLNRLPLRRVFTYNDHFLRRKVDIIHFSLGSGLEIALDETDLFQLVTRMDIPFTIHCHELWISDGLDPDVRQRLKLVFDKAAAVFFTSRYAARQVEINLGHTFSNMETLASPVQSPDLLAGIPVQQRDSLRLCLLGDLVTNRKGQDIALRALASPRLRALDWELQIVGSGPDEDHLRQLVIQLGLEDRVRLVGKSRDLFGTLADHDIFLFPSLTDSGPITLVECMLAGRVVVATPLGLAHELVRDGENGFLASGFDADAFADALHVCFTQRDTLQTVGNAARASTRQEYDLNPTRTMLARLQHLAGCGA